MSRRARRLFSLVLVGLWVLAAGACAQPSQAPTGGAPRAAEGAAAAGGRQAETTERPPLRVAYVSPIAAMAPLWIGVEEGTFARQGVSVEMRYIQANAAVPALLAGEVDLLQISAPAVLPPALQGADLVFIVGAFNSMIWTVRTLPEIRSAQDLKGKLIGSDRPGTPVAFGVEVALEKLGLQPADVQILNVGSSDKVLPALLSGQLAATVLGPPASFIAEDAGFPALVDLYEVPYQGIGIVAQRSRLAALEPSVVPFLKGYREAIDLYHGDRALALRAIGKYSQEGTPEILERTYEFYHARGFNRGLGVTEAGLTSVLSFLGKTMPEAQTAQPEQFFESRYVRQLP